jgi:hypothetical protein
MYRAAITAPDRLAIKWNSSSGAAMHAASWVMHEQPMPVVIALGCSPAVTFAATLPLPPSLDEFTFAGLLQGEAVKIFSCSNGLVAPHDAEIVIEGYLEQGSTGSGAFGNHSGFYSPSEPAASVKVTAVRIRSDMILPATVVGKPPMEDCWLARAGVFCFSPAKRRWRLLPSQPFAGIFHGPQSFHEEYSRRVLNYKAIQKTPVGKAKPAKSKGSRSADEAPLHYEQCHWAEDMIPSRKPIDKTRKVLKTRIRKRDAGITELEKRRRSRLLMLSTTGNCFER